jgi:hypothetical protein
MNLHGISFLRGPRRRLRPPVPAAITSAGSRVRTPVVKTKRPFQGWDYAYSISRDEGCGKKSQEPAAGCFVSRLHSRPRIRIAASLEKNLRAQNGRLLIPSPVGEWSVSGLIVQGSSPGHSYPRLLRARVCAARSATSLIPRPGGRRSADAPGDFSTVRTNSRLSQRSKPGQARSSPFRLAIYRHAGWFQPDPETQTPYYVVNITGEVSVSIAESLTLESKAAPVFQNPRNYE